MADLVKFFVGLHQPADAHRFERACISINRLRGRKKPIAGCEVLVDSGAFTELHMHGRYRHEVIEYAAELYRLHQAGVVKIVAAVAQDYMCEPFMLLRTALADGYGYSIRETEIEVSLAANDDDDEAGDARTATRLRAEPYLTPEQTLVRTSLHQERTIQRYDALVAELDRLFAGRCPFPVLPVLQGYAPAEYVTHLIAYGARLAHGMWVGVGSVCKRNSAPEKIAAVLRAIKAVRPDLLLHGFGVKVTALLNTAVRDLLATADSMAWSFAARKQGRSANSWHEAAAFCNRIAIAIAGPREAYQLPLFEAAA